MPERIQLTGPPEQAAAQLWAHIQEKTMLEGEKLPKFESPEEAAEEYLDHMTHEELEQLIRDLIKTLQKMRTEREDIFDKIPRWKMQLASWSRKNIFAAPACLSH